MPSRQPSPTLSASTLLELSASELSVALAAGRVTCEAVMRAYLRRIESVNPSLNAIVALQPREALLAAARQADAEPRRGWLHGIPVAPKDMQSTAGTASTQGSPIFADHIPAEDDPLPARLRLAGAIVIGKTNTPEFGLGSNTYNPVYGTTRNPYDRRRSAGGSSGGAAAALAARLLPLADGSDMMGSLRNPAAFCNVYGFRPSYGQVPAAPGGDTFLHQLSTDGPMARTVEDIARLLDTLAEPDARLPHSRRHPPHFTEQLRTDIAGRRIAWLSDWQGYLPMEAGITELCEQALHRFEELGCEVESVDPGFDADALWQAWITLRSFALANSLKPHFDEPATRAQLKPEALWEIERGLALTGVQVHEASVIRSHWFDHCASLFQRADVLVLPSAQVFPFAVKQHWPDNISERPLDTYHRWMEVVIPASLAGLPALNVPAGFNQAGLPMGMQLIGARGNDAGVLQLGQAYHELTRWPQQRRPG